MRSEFGVDLRIRKRARPAPWSRKWQGLCCGVQPTLLTNFEAKLQLKIHENLARLHLHNEAGFLVCMPSWQALHNQRLTLNKAGFLNSPCLGSHLSVTRAHSVPLGTFGFIHKTWKCCKRRLSRRFGRYLLRRPMLQVTKLANISSSSIFVLLYHSLMSTWLSHLYIRPLLSHRKWKGHYIRTTATSTTRNNPLMSRTSKILKRCS